MLSASLIIDINNEDFNNLMAVLTILLLLLLRKYLLLQINAFIYKCID